MHSEARAVVRRSGLPHATFCRDAECAGQTLRVGEITDHLAVLGVSADGRRNGDHVVCSGQGRRGQHVDDLDLVLTRIEETVAHPHEVGARLIRPRRTACHEQRQHTNSAPRITDGYSAAQSAKSGVEYQRLDNVLRGKTPSSSLSVGKSTVVGCPAPSRGRSSGAAPEIGGGDEAVFQLVQDPR